MKITNALSIFRFICALAIATLFIFWLQDLTNYDNTTTTWSAIPIIFIIGVFTDFLDGFIARKKKMVTTFGKIIDPIADKALINTSLIVILAFNFLQRSKLLLISIFISTVLMILRDIIVDAAKISLAYSNQKLDATIAGKIKTILQIAAISFTFLLIWDAYINDANIAKNMPEIFNFTTISWLFIIATSASVISGYMYVIKAWKTKK